MREWRNSRPGLGTWGTWWCQTLWLRRGGWGHRTSASSAWVYGSRCRTEPRYRYRTSRLCSRRAGGLIELRCMAPLRCLTPAHHSTLRHSTTTRSASTSTRHQLLHSGTTKAPLYPSAVPCSSCTNCQQNVSTRPKGHNWHVAYKCLQNTQTIL